MRPERLRPSTDRDPTLLVKAGRASALPALLSHNAAWPSTPLASVDGDPTGHCRFSTVRGSVPYHPPPCARRRPTERQSALSCNTQFQPGGANASAGASALNLKHSVKEQAAGSFFRIDHARDHTSQVISPVSAGLSARFNGHDPRNNTSHGIPSLSRELCSSRPARVKNSASAAHSRAYFL